VKATGVKVTDTTASTVTLTWDNFDKYYITCTSHPGATQFVDGNTVTFGGLQPGQTYKFAITALDCNWSAAATTVNVSAKTQAYPAVTGVQVTATNYNSVSLSWAPSAFSATSGYEVLCYDATGKTLLKTVPVSGKATTFATITGLDASTKYTFVVRAISSSLSIKSAPAKISASTLKYPAVTGVQVTAINYNLVSLTWAESTVPATTGYEILCYDATGKYLLKTVTVSGKTTLNATVTGLHPLMKYTFVVRAVSSTLSVHSLDAKITASTSLPIVA